MRAATAGARFRIARAAGLVVTALLTAAPAAAQSPYDRCSDIPPGALPQIEVLPESGPLVLRADTCALSPTLESYTGLCGIAQVPYPGPDAIYEVRLHEGNRVGFRLGPEGGPGGSPDLVLALLDRCGDGGSCLFNSPDFIGPGAEEIPPRSYPPGVYYLYADSAALGADSCGSYTLAVEGTNPVPDLRTSLTATPVPAPPGSCPDLTAPPPDKAVAGRNLTYTLAVQNPGDLDATGVEALLELPRDSQGKAQTGVERLPAGCKPAGGGRVRCVLGTLAVGSTETRSLEVRVEPTARDRLVATATAEAVEGEPTPVDNRATAEIGVRAEVDLAIEKSQSPGQVVAGCPVVYDLRVTNRGPSTAFDTRLTDFLSGSARVLDDGAPAETDFHPDCPRPLPPCPSPPAACRRRSGRVECSLGSLGPDAPEELCLPMRILPDAEGTLANEVRVGSAPGEVECRASDNLSGLRSEVVRRTDLAIIKEAVTGSDPPGVLVGNSLEYEVTVENLGPSDSSGATVEDRPSPGVVFDPSSEDACELDQQEPGKVVCRVAPEASTKETVRFSATVDPSVAPTLVPNQATVRAEDEDLHSANDTSGDVRVEIRADLSLDKTVQPKPVVAGSTLAYRLTVRNQGLSDSPGGEAIDGLPEELTFVASPDGCTLDEDSGTERVRCPFGPIPVDEEVELRFVARVDPSAGERTIANLAEIDSRHDPDGSNDTTSVSTPIVRQAGLTVQKSDDPDPVLSDRDLAYSVSVLNRGPSDATEVRLCDFLPGGVDSPDPLPEGCKSGPDAVRDCPAPEDHSGTILLCDLLEEDERLPPGDSTEPFELTVNAPSGRGPIENLALALSAESDPWKGSAEESEITTVAEADDRDLAVSVTESADPVRVGELLIYTVRLVHRGPASKPAEDVEVAARLPDGTTFSTASKGCEADSDLVTCTVPEVGQGAPEDLEIGVTVQEEGVLTLEVKVEESPEGGGLPTDPEDGCPEPAPSTPSDPEPNRLNNCVTEETLAVETPKLVLPFFEADAEGLGVATLFAVRNLDDEPVDADYAYVSPRGQELFHEMGVPLSGQAVRPVNLRDLTDDLFPAGETFVTGSVGISPTNAMGRLLAGDFFRVDPGNRSASGSLLVDTDSRRSPRQLCRQWAVRFLNGGAFDGETELVFWNPAGRGNEEAPKERTIRGRVYTEAGDFVQEVTVSTEKHAFTRSTREGFDGGTLGPDLLASFGVIEWEFPEGVAGNVSAVHRAEGRFAVGVPGVCLDPRPPDHQPGRDSPLVVPFFEVEPEVDGATTLFAVRNEADSSVDVVFRYLPSQAGPPAFKQTCTLAAREVRTLNLRDLGTREDSRCDPATRPSEGDELRTGFVEVQAVADDPSQDAFLSGDYFRVHPDTDLAAGEALIDTGASANPPQVCQRWVTRLIHGGGFVGSTEFVFYAPNPDSRGEAFVGDVLDEDGSLQATVELHRTATSFQVSSGDLALPLRSQGQLFGSVEWTFPGGRPGHVSTLFRAEGKFSVLVPGVCLDGLDPPDEPEPEQ